eukprot:7373403-Pyramimonas_sp.AAC.1
MHSNLGQCTPGPARSCKIWRSDWPPLAWTPVPSAPTEARRPLAGGAPAVITASAGLLHHNP